MKRESLKFYNGFGGFDTSESEYVIFENTPLPWINCVSSVEGEPFGFLVSEKGGGYVWQGNSRETPLTRWYCNPAEDPSDEEYCITDLEGNTSFSPFENAICRHGFGYSIFEGSKAGITWKLTVFVPIGHPVKVSVLLVTAENTDKEIAVKYSVRSEYEHAVYSSLDEGQSCKIKNGDRNGFVFLLSKNENAFEGFTEFHPCMEAFDKVKKYWQEYLEKIRVSTPDESVNVIMNGWLLYQTVSCRIKGRTAFYQCGGAYGFRDQLQDSLALLYVDPNSVKERILLHASRQYEEGDVQHWWHPPANAGIRSRYSDDLLWLVYVTFRYVEATGDTDILNIKVPYIKSKPLESSEIDRYETPEVSEKNDTLFAHCLLACKHAMRFGEHGIPLIMGGDWNDGMNRVGLQGKGESIWLGWFLCYCIQAICKMSLYMKDSAVDRRKLTEEAEKIAGAIEKHAWDGSWYMRAFCDSGRILGSSGSSECMIDSIAQSWAVISGFADKERAKTAILSAERFLADYENGIVKLLTPPFSAESIEDVGYIASYPPGIRENGAQYTHAAIWLAKAFLCLDEDEFARKGKRILDIINPVNHARTELEAARYKTEPYVVSADVYSGGNIGRGGWSWYTGSASWMYQVILEDLLGFSVRYSECKDKAELIIKKVHVPEWNEYTIEYRYKSSLYVITLRKKETNKQQHSEKKHAELLRVIKLIDDGKRHEVLISFH